MGTVIMKSSDADEAESQMLFGCVVSICLRDVGMLTKAQNADGDIAESRHDPGTGLRSDAAAIFVIGNIPDVMHFIFNTPVPAVDLKKPFRAGFLGR